MTNSSGRGRSQQTKGVAESRLRADQRKTHRPIDPAVLLTEQAVREHLEAFLCPYCGAGPFILVANHTNQAHGVGADELRERAGVGYAQSLTPAEYREEKSRRGKERGVPAEALEALQEARRNGTATRRSSPAVVAANTRNYQVRIERLREVEEYRSLPDAELRRIAASPAVAALMERVEERRAVSDPEVERLVAEGKTYAEVARIMGISTFTVSATLKRLGHDVDGRARPAAKASHAEAIAAAKEAHKRNTAERREALKQRWLATDQSWETLLSFAEETGRTPKVMQAHLKRLGLSIPDGRVETVKRRTNYKPKRHECDITGCPREHVARGLCRYHYQEWRIANGRVPACAEAGCEKPVVARGLCSTHYSASRASKPEKEIPRD